MTDDNRSGRAPIAEDVARPRALHILVAAAHHHLALFDEHHAHLLIGEINGRLGKFRENTCQYENVSDTFSSALPIPASPKSSEEEKAAAIEISDDEKPLADIRRARFSTEAARHGLMG